MIPVAIGRKMSDTAPPEELILKAWNMKVAGEAFFSGIALRFPERATELELVAAAELAAAALIEPIAQSRGIELDADTVISGVVRHVEGLGPDLAVILGESAELGRASKGLYRELGFALPEDQARLAPELADIEDAIVEFLEGLLDGRGPDHSRRLEEIVAGADHERDR
jgi:hypothetical protein